MTNQYDPLPHGKPILLVDFDGVIHSYESGWQGVDVIFDPPVPGVFAWLENALVNFEIHVYSSRSSSLEGRNAIIRYIVKHGGTFLAGQLHYTAEKSRAFLTIDDRCVCFNGNWSAPELNSENLIKFKPWNKKS
jgi:hypothetical protein